MIGASDPYYNLPEVSNSDLHEVMKIFYEEQQRGDIEAAYRFGNLVDALITEPNRCNHIKRTVDDVQFTEDEWRIAYEMLKAFRADPIGQVYLKNSVGQKVFQHHNFEIEYQGFTFSVSARCKYDLFHKLAYHGGDIKSTVATTQKQFEESIRYFDYDQQRAWYMDLSGSSQDMLFGISKKNFQVFKFPIRRGDKTYVSGKEKYQAAAFRYWYLFTNF